MLKKISIRALSLITVFALLLSIPVFSSASTPLLAFPEADGMGKYTVGGRGGAVYEVTTLEDGKNIPGSLRAAVEAAGPRTVIFKVAGTIALKETLKIKNPNITIAGQSAPGEGITLKDYGVSIQTDQVIVRNIRFRMGEHVEDDSLTISSANNVILDHCSASWGVDETLSVKRSNYVTVQWSFVTEGLHASIHESGDHSKGSLIGGQEGQKVSFNHNLYAHHDARSPRPQGLLQPEEDQIGFFFDFTNNVVYDWGRAYAAKNLDEKSVCTMNFVNNYFIAGPSSDASNFMLDKNINTSMYFSGNYMDGKMPTDQYSLIIYEDFIKPANRQWKLDEPFDAMTNNVQTAEQAFASVLKNGGAAVNRDAVDERIVSEVLSGKGRIIDKTSDVGGWPVLEAGTAYLDSDHDGMPDSWETEKGLDPNNANDGNLDRNADGYTNLEEYLNGLMSHLYAEELAVPTFNNRFQKIYHFFYRVFRAYIEVQRFFESVWEKLGFAK